ncbi:DUF2607 family protein [Vibrio aquimaris]|uniref:DUF2607 family protein n=1 Tax=Vibrio aquimaris TaxID=2587862 RepID=UPI001267EE6B|nr:DUF2607 family protein [Vibrio aquimaris]
MTQTHRPPARHSSTLAVIAIVLVLWMSWASIFHQYQFSTHHDEHHCQLFSCLKHGSNYSQITLFDNPLAHEHSFSQKYDLYQKAVFSYLARSPPVNLI